MKPVRYGIVGGGFISGFQLRALAQVRGVEVAGLVSRRSPD
jgi:predicted dehydrogenase